MVMIADENPISTLPKQSYFYRLYRHMYMLFIYGSYVKNGRVTETYQ